MTPWISIWRYEKKKKSWQGDENKKKRRKEENWLLPVQIPKKKNLKNPQTSQVKIYKPLESSLLYSAPTQHSPLLVPSHHLPDQQDPPFSYKSEDRGKPSLFSSVRRDPYQFAFQEKLSKRWKRKKKSTLTKRKDSVRCTSQKPLLKLSCTSNKNPLMFTDAPKLTIFVWSRTFSWQIEPILSPTHQKIGAILCSERPCLFISHSSEN